MVSVGVEPGRAVAVELAADEVGTQGGVPRARHRAAVAHVGQAREQLRVCGYSSCSRGESQAFAFASSACEGRAAPGRPARPCRAAGSRWRGRARGTGARAAASRTDRRCARRCRRARRTRTRAPRRCAWRRPCGRRAAGRRRSDRRVLDRHRSPSPRPSARGTAGSSRIAARRVRCRTTGAPCCRSTMDVVGANICARALPGRARSTSSKRSPIQSWVTTTRSMTSSTLGTGVACATNGSSVSVHASSSSSASAQRFRTSAHGPSAR